MLTGGLPLLSKSTALKLAPDTIDRLRRIAHQRSLDGKEQLWTHVGRALLEDALAQAERAGTPPSQNGGAR